MTSLFAVNTRLGWQLISVFCYLNQFVEAFLQRVAQRRVAVQLVGHVECVSGLLQLPVIVGDDPVVLVSTLGG